MREARLRLPELITIAATRGMLGIGIGLLVAGRLPRARRREIGTVLTAIGALSTIPLAIRMFRRSWTLDTDGHTATTRETPARVTH